MEKILHSWRKIYETFKTKTTHQYILIILKNAKSSIFGVKFDFSREMNDILKSRDGNEELVGCS